MIAGLASTPTTVTASISGIVRARRFHRGAGGPAFIRGADVDFAYVLLHGTPQALMDGSGT